MIKPEFTTDQSNFLINAIDLKVRNEGLQAAGMGLACAAILQQAAVDAGETETPAGGGGGEAGPKEGDLGDGGTA